MRNSSARTVLPITLFSVVLGVTAAGVVTKVLADKAKQAELGGPKRYLTALSTDKPMYRPGETVWVRGVLLNAFDHKPLPEPANPTIEIRGPKGEVVASGSSSTQDSVWAFSWVVPAGMAGGEYTLKATYPWNGHAPAQRKFDVRVYRAPRLKTQIVFLRDGYGPGDKVTATLEVKRAEGGVPTGAKVTATALVDGNEVARIPSTVDGKGLCRVSFALPKTIERGEGSMAFAIEDGGVVETAAKTIPILLQTLDLTMFPEGGDLASGVPNRIYFQALTPSRKPADIAGSVIDETGQIVARFRSEHEGRGRFDITPASDNTYTLRVEQPTGIKTTWKLPAVAVGGVTVRAREDLTRRGAQVAVQVASARPRTVKITLNHREKELSSSTVKLTGGKTLADVSLSARGAEGVLVVTVFGEKGEPLAERLVYRQPSDVLKVDLRADKKTYVPGETVRLTATATRGGQPVSAVIGLTVTDDAVLELIEKREQVPQLPVMMLLEPEVKELADAHVYLDERNAKAPRALDLLLATQGWRRFAVMAVPDFVAKYGDDGRRALAVRIQTRNEMMNGFELGAVGGGAVRGNLGMRGRGQAAGVKAGRPMPMRARAARDAELEGFADLAGPPGAPAAPPPAPPRAEAAPERRMDNKEAKVVANKPMAPAAVASQAAAPPPQEALQGAIAKAEEAEADMMVLGKDQAKKRMMMPRPRPPVVVVVREYAHQVQPNRRPDERSDFAETVYWHAGIRTSGTTGEATVRFALNDSVTAFKVFANGFSNSGALGLGTSSIKSVQPFYAEPKLPLEVTAGDQISLPVSLVNGTPNPMRGARITLTSNLPAGAAGLDIATLPKLDLKPQERVRRILDINVGPVNTTADLTLNVTADPYVDIVKRKLVIKSNGFPAVFSWGGITNKDGKISHAVTIPTNVVAGSMRTSIAVYPTPLANLTQALARLIQEPSGCFEQTSSTSYPLTMAQQYFKSHTGVDPKLIATAAEKLDAGYLRLVSFETPDKGYEWFGEKPGHEALTAFGLMHFADMKEVRNVDDAMIARNRNWLLAQRDGQGAFARKRRALHTWIEDQDCSNGYIVWSLLETGNKAGLEKEIAAFKTAAGKSDNSYVAALGANVLALAGDMGAAKGLMQKLAAKQGKTGAVTGGTTTIVGSGGEALEIETTALAVLAWLRDPSFAGSVEKSMKFLADSCDGGRYGSTQSTVLALRAIVAYDKARARPKAGGNLVVAVDGQAIGKPVPFDSATQGTIALPDIAGALKGGGHTIEVRMQGGVSMPYSIALDYNALTPSSAKECKLDLDVRLNQTRAGEGDLMEAIATVANRTKESIPTPVAIVGLPGGLEPRHDQLKELVKKGTISAYEVIGREIVLYWRGMGAGQRVSVPLSLVAAIPGRYTGPASRAYLYYTDEHKTWVDGLKVEITPKL